MSSEPAARCASPFPHGEVGFVEDKAIPPNRAYLKLWEAFTLLGRHPGAGERCLDMGASPGGWTWVLQSLGAQVLGISVDGIWSHLAFARERKLRFPLLADFHPKGEVCRRYQAYRELEGYAERALYVIDREGVIAWSHLSPPEVNPGVDGVLEALERLPPHSEPPEALS